MSQRNRKPPGLGENPAASLALRHKKGNQRRGAPPSPTPTTTPHNPTLPAQPPYTPNTHDFGAGVKLAPTAPNYHWCNEFNSNGGPQQLFSSGKKETNKEKIKKKKSHHNPQPRNISNKLESCPDFQVCAWPYLVSPSSLSFSLPLFLFFVSFFFFIVQGISRPEQLL